MRQTLFHQVNNSKPTEIDLTPNQAAGLLKKNLIIRTGSTPDQVSYTSSQTLSTIKKTLTDIEAAAKKAAAQAAQRQATAAKRTAKPAKGKGKKRKTATAS